MNPIIEELKQRGMWNASFGNVEDLIKPGAKVYCGTDPTNPPDGSKASLHVGHLMMFTTARLLQSMGLQPIILVGTATCSLGDPSGKDAPLLPRAARNPAAPACRRRPCSAAPWQSCAKPPFDQLRQQGQ